MRSDKGAGFARRLFIGGFESAVPSDGDFSGRAIARALRFCAPTMVFLKKTNQGSIVTGVPIFTFW